MVRVTSLAEKEIHEIGEAFANHNYVDGEKGMYSYFKNYDAVCRYISDYARRAMERGNLYSTSDNHEAYISFRTSNESMVDAVGIGIAKSLIRNMGFFGAIDFLRRLLAAGVPYDKKLKRENKEFIVVGLLAVTEKYQGQGYMRKVLDIAFEEGRKRNCPVYLETDGVDKRDKYMSLGMECVGTRKISEGSYLYDLVKWP
ncbi:MAG: GNAT family N-acetyltransferase [Firmicutes bacterium]|nr:GNAT family N-acetyltransferase [Bacillota bacterium]